MEKEFVPYEIALALEEIGFEEKCISVFLTSSKQPYPMYRPYTKKEKTDELLRPTFSQAFRWFREKCGLHEDIQVIPSNPYTYFYKVNRVSGGVADTYEEAELECLKKLIEIAQKK